MVSHDGVNRVLLCRILGLKPGSGMGVSSGPRLLEPAGRTRSGTPVAGSPQRCLAPDAAFRRGGASPGLKRDPNG